MPVNLHPEGRARLVELLSQALVNTRVSHNMFLDHRALVSLAELDAAAPSPTSKVGALLARFVSTEPIADFVRGELTARLSRREYRADSLSSPLTDIPEFEDPSAAAVAIVQALETLPWRYEVYAAIPPTLGDLLSRAIGEHEFEFDERLALVPGATLQGPYPATEQSPESALLFAIPTRLEAEQLYLRVRIEGYVAPFGDTVPIDDAHALVRAFFGLAIALRWARTGMSYSFTPPKRHLIVYRGVNEGWEQERPQEMPADVANAIAGLGLSKVLGGQTERDRVGYLRSELSRLRAAFVRRQDCRGVLLAAQWLFDSWATSNRLLGFVQAMVAIEALLGDKASSEATGLGELLANRAAFLIATTRSQRDDVLADFRRIYDTRSKIVHRGKNRLTAADLNDLSRLEWLCARVIQEEVRLLGVEDE